MTVELGVFDPARDAQLLRHWLQQPHVARWWGEAWDELQDLLRRSPGSNAVILEDGIPVGFLCWEPPPRRELEAAALTDLPRDLVDIDIMVGEPSALGRGIGPRALELLLIRLGDDPQVSFAGLGTSVSNTRAIRAYEKAGFRAFRAFQDPAWGPCLYMVAEVGALPSTEGTERRR